MTPSKGTPPPSVLASKEYRRQLLSAEPGEYDEQLTNDDVDVDTHTEELVSHPSVADVAKLDPIRMLEVYFENQNPMMVRLDTEHFSMELPVCLVSVNDHALAFFIAREHVGFEPKVSSELDITINRNTYKVIYAGGAFTFKGLPYRMLSFMRVDTEDGEKSSS